MADEEDTTNGEVRDPEAQTRSQEAARYRTERNQLAEELKSAKVEREELRSARLESAVHRANSKLSEPFVDPEVALRLLNPADLRWDANGKPSGVAEALEQLAADYPALLSTAPQAERQASAGMTGNANRNSGGSNLDIGALKKRYPILRRQGQ